MSNFNLGNYFKNIFSAKKKENVGEQIETKLTEKNKNEKESNELTEGLLKKDRWNVEESSIEKRLDQVRAGGAEVIVEGRLNTSKSTLVKHRNIDAAKGDINKLEEKRLAGETMESEKQELASEMDKPRRFWEVKSPDGLKLAKNIKVADIMDFDIDDDLTQKDEINDEIEEVEMPSFTEVTKEELSPEALMELDQLSKEFEKNKDPEEQIAIDDIINDPEALSSIFSEEVVGVDESSGTPMEERIVTFDIEGADEAIMNIFRKGKRIDRQTLKKAIINFINFNHPEEVIDSNSLQIDVDTSGLNGSATYIVATK